MLFQFMSSNEPYFMEMMGYLQGQDKAWRKHFQERVEEAHSPVTQQWRSILDPHRARRRVRAVSGEEDDDGRKEERYEERDETHADQSE